MKRNAQIPIRHPPPTLGPEQVFLHQGWVSAAVDAMQDTTRATVFLNVDETMVAYGYKKVRGTVYKVIQATRLTVGALGTLQCRLFRC